MYIYTFCLVLIDCMAVMILNKQRFYSVLHQATQVSVPLKPGEQKLEGTLIFIAIIMWYSFEHDWPAKPRLLIFSLAGM